MTIAARIIPALMLAVLLQGFASRALASEQPISTPTATVSTTVEDDILWLTADVAEADETIRIKILAPAAKQGRRSLWQVCEFGSTGNGEYRCGIDVGPGSNASKRDGAWIAKLFIGSDVVARARFTL